ncbi:MAG: hypothetical protein M1133_08590 [Armatimonadetes bacterium]|nr:hypothetical protein [Armatimonadota bacterium]
MVNRMYMRNLWKGKRGTSLIEVLVVMAVLLVGIMTVVQMFPTGFRVVRAGESQSIASKLAQQEIERWKGLSANLPAGIVPIRDDGTLWYGSYPTTGDVNSKGAMPGPSLYGHFDFGSGIERANALNRRYVIGETTAIPTANYFQTGGGAVFGSRYMLAFSPIDVSRDANGELDGLAIKGGDMRRRDIDPSYLKAGEFAARGFIEGNTLRFQVAVAPDRNVVERVYHVSFSYWARTGQNDPGTLYTKLDAQVPVVHNGLDNRDRSVWVDVPFTPVNGTAESIEMDSIACARAFQEQPGSWTLDPYEFKLADPILGVVAFNPNGNGVYEHTSLGLKPLEARIDYRIYDLRIIREDRVVPAPAPSSADTIPIKMALRFILNVGDPTDNPDEQDGYKGLMTGSQIVPVPIYIVDLATGLQMETPSSFFVDNVDFKIGTVDVPRFANLVDWEGNVISPDVDMVGRHLRFFYRADGDWSVQCHKAYSNYTRVYDDTSLIDYRSYMLAAPNRLLFVPCDLDQMVSVDFTYGKIGGGNDGEHRVVGYCAQIQLDSTNGDICVDLPLPVGAEIRRLAVVGVSLRARVVWRDGKVWRHVDMDTNLTRE